MTNRQAKPNSKKTEAALVAICAAALLIASSCGKELVYNQYHRTGHAWEKDAAHAFAFTIDDETAAYDLILEVRNNGLYPYSNLWLFCDEASPDGRILSDTIDCELADNFGKWNGKGVSIYHSSFPLRTGYKFPRKGEYTISVRQGMRRDTLKGITEIGLRIEKAR
ncbi:MAG: gliding motility lipoprotein GldH [Tannerellaceae bacterium]|jgi:gliding motility-associated lipoprotein GldH|nr:gliding motility lipoprotein GldH [Tannerellaceae bacterium]